MFEEEAAAGFQQIKLALECKNRQHLRSYRCVGEKAVRGPEAEFQAVQLCPALPESVHSAQAPANPGERKAEPACRCLRVHYRGDV